MAHIKNAYDKDTAILNDLKSQIVYPPRIETEALSYELIYDELKRRRNGRLG